MQCADDCVLAYEYIDKAAKKRSSCVGFSVRRALSSTYAGIDYYIDLIHANNVILWAVSTASNLAGCFVNFFSCCSSG